MKIQLIDANNYLRRKFESSFNVPSIVPLLSPEPMFWVFDGKGALKARQDLLERLHEDVVDGRRQRAALGRHDRWSAANTSPWSNRRRPSFGAWCVR